ncbi:hypothetical protein ABG82_19395 [Mycobacteroides immunogenum]|uniref:Uncharacterized protein n=1 Tax=Mycobacteroides immunogenum TaxID=83262 RepID=A0A7V8LL14_9MYCO|nr:hypothetical protein ABG82_19395 [Mycobacteroides immunogenum]KPG04319.1 hypothetical protein AN909_23370 [Mycobacteroides immunogenum]KPG04862.1 hypothetical protein AN908_23840 [Mycobacteroides immunogenum]KPG05703.1 hypothetical protein AN910_23110 [Mycobacteroides immunogenum]KPG19273.1 hypothetical protein AN911_23535 [Mycobacteroides immunogenum]
MRRRHVEGCVAVIGRRTPLCPVCRQPVYPTADRTVRWHNDSLGACVCPMSGKPYGSLRPAPESKAIAS